MNNKLSFSFQVSTSSFIKSASYTENRQKYLLFILSGILLLNQETGWNPLLVVPDDNSPLTNQFKNLKVGEFISNYTTSFSNLKFLPKFHNFFEGAENQEPEIRNGLLVKDTGQVQKLTNISYPEFTFKVINQFKGGHGKTASGERLSYQESFSTSGNYEHILEIEPVNLGIENFPFITRLVFEFARPLNPGGAKPLRESYLYNNNILTN